MSNQKSASCVVLLTIESSSAKARKASDKPKKAKIRIPGISLGCLKAKIDKANANVQVPTINEKKI